MTTSTVQQGFHCLQRPEPRSHLDISGHELQVELSLIAIARAAAESICKHPAIAETPAQCSRCQGFLRIFKGPLKGTERISDNLQTASSLIKSWSEHEFVKNTNVRIDALLEIMISIRANL